MELFQQQQIGRLPLARRASPDRLDEFAGQEHLLGLGAPIRRALESRQPVNAVFFGPPGCGKTALARLMAKNFGLEAVEISCVTTGAPAIRKAMEAASLRFEAGGKPTLLVLDEIHHLNRTQQDTLLPYMESGAVALIGLTTENPFFYIHRAVLSRALVYEFKKLEDRNIERILQRSLELCCKESKPPALEEAAKNYLVRFASGDARKLLNAVEFLASQTTEKSGPWNREEIEKLLGLKQIAYDKKEDSHYDTASAFIKSMRGSDPDAAVYWLAKMLEGGEDPRFIARRIVIAASEDVGNADPLALVVAQSAFHAVEMLGLPEGAIPLAHAAIYIASAPKSNAAYLALKSAQEEIRRGQPQEVPIHLKDASQDTSLGHGQGYLYSHDYPEHFIQQKYMEKFKLFYQPTTLGAEAAMRERLEKLWKRKYG